MGSLVGTPWLTMRIVPEVSYIRRSCNHISSIRRCFSVKACTSPSSNGASFRKGDGEVRVRFAPSPTGNLHVGGARTALFNYLFARSTKASEETVLQDLTWLGLKWDEGPDIGRDYGPYRQSERNSLYKEYAKKLLQTGQVYRCFCSSEELEKMKEIAKEKSLPPVYSGKWASASEEEVQEELAKGTPFTYRFRVPKEGSLKIDDLIRGEVSWNLNTLGDFVIMRSNGQPVYNFCVTVDDATMAISHALIYEALGHGATSVGQYREMGYLPQGMVNYLALLGWGVGTENEFFTLDDLVEKFSISRVNKSGAVFDATKLRWMNGLHLRALPPAEFNKLIADRWVTAGILTVSKGPFVEEAVQLLKDGIDLITDADKALLNLLSYPLLDTLNSIEGKPVLEDKLAEFCTSLLAAYDSGELLTALEEGTTGWQKWVKAFGKSLKRKGKSLFMPLRVLLTGKLHGPEMLPSIVLLYKASTSNVVTPNTGFKPLEERFELLRQLDWEALNKDQPLPEPVPVASN
ncbi:unnamed protein product [Rhodiola kirilowii]